MTPGLAARRPPFPAKATKNAVVVVASLEKSTVPMVVGVCEIDIASLQHVQGVKGHAVRGEHWAGDEVWAWSQGGLSGQAAPDAIEGWAEEDTSANLEHRMEKASLDDHEGEEPDDDGDGGVLLEQNIPSQSKFQTNGYVDGEDVLPYEEVSVEERQLTIKGERSKIYSIARTENRLQKSMRYLEMHFFMQYISSITQTKMNHVVVSAFLSRNRSLFQTLSYHIYL